MHGLSELGTSVPAFLAKLWKLVNDPETDDLICWSDGGQTFIITNPSRFTQELLPMYYKHNNMASFIRQLNMYGFHKVVSVETGGLKSEKDHMEFSHTCFVRGHPYLIENIKRKMSSTHRTTVPILSYVKDAGADADVISQGKLLTQVLSDVNELKSKQASWDSKLAAMKRENETLWRELAIFRQKHHKQEQIINKLIRFIVTMVQPSPRNVPLRRRFPLMLSDVQRTATKIRPAASSSLSSGPTIRELDPAEFLLGEEVASADDKWEKGEEYILPHLVEDLPQEEFVSSSLVPDHPYVVLSPESGVSEDLAQANQASTTSSTPWLHIDLSDTDTEAMTPINPASVNQKVAPMEALLKSTVKESAQSTSSSSSDVRPAKVQKLSKGVAPASSAVFKLAAPRKGRKNAKPKKTLSKYRKTNKVPAADPTGDLSMDIKVEIPLEGSPLLGEVPESENGGVTILKMSPIFEEQEVPEVDMASEMTTLPEVEPLDPISLALVRANSGYCAEDVSRELENHVDTVQGDIDLLKEFLKGDGCSLDASSLLELFNDDPLSYTMPPAPENKTSSKEDDAAGNELMTYGQPNLLDLMDLYGSGNSVPPPASPSPSLLNTPIATPRSPLLTPSSSGKKRQK